MILPVISTKGSWLCGVSVERERERERGGVGGKRERDGERDRQTDRDRERRGGWERNKAINKRGCFASKGQSGLVVSLYAFSSMLDIFGGSSPKLDRPSVFDPFIHSKTWPPVRPSIHPFIHSFILFSSNQNWLYFDLWLVWACVKSHNNNNNNNNLFYMAPQQQLCELLALYRSTNAIEHTSICYLN